MVQLMHMEMVVVIWSLGDDFDGVVEMLDDDPLMCHDGDELYLL